MGQRGFCRCYVARMSKTTACPTGTETALPANAQDGFISERELRQRLPLSGRTLYSMRTSGRLPFVRLPGSRRVIYHWRSVEAALLRQQRGMEA